FKNEDEARVAGRLLGDTLLVAGAVARIGVDIGFSRSTLQFSEEVHAAVKKETGLELRAETHGLMVYEEDSISIAGVNAHGTVFLAPNMLEQNLKDWIDTVEKITER